MHQHRPPVHRLYCGVAEGCKPVLHDFTTSGETTQKFSSSSVNMKACLRV